MLTLFACLFVRTTDLLTGHKMKDLIDFCGYGTIKNIDTIMLIFEYFFSL